MLSRLCALAIVSLAAVLGFSSSSRAADEKPLKLLFLGDQGHHRPADRAAQLIPVMAERGIQIRYTEDMQELALDNLRKYDGLIIFANTTEISREQESALLEYVAGGGGFIPLHCASYCFLNSPAYVDLVGAQFSKHGGEVFSTEIVQPHHPIMEGFGGFKSWDETYIHTKHNERNRTVLEVRRQGGQAEGREAEPWTWVRTQGQGRVFYTAWGHDERTWGNPGFQNLVERGIRWACNRDPSIVPPFQDASLFPIPPMTAMRTDVAPFEYEDVGPKIPNYVPSNQWGTRGENLSKMQKPLAPAESIKHFVTPQRFHLELFVSEPELQGKPIAMNWDHRGRLWVCETVDYPNELKDADGRDRIRICEDTNGDGKADKFTVFAEGLSIPSSLEFYRDGVIVQAGIETLFLRDTDGDDKADDRTTLITGWAMGDTHGGVSNFQYGLDNRYWAMQGYNDSHPEFARGRHPGFRQGPFNFTVKGDKPEVTDVEFVRSTTNNSWGLGISEEGLIFASTANRAPSFFVPIPNRYYERVKGWTPNLMADAIFDTHLFRPITDKVRQVDHHGGYTAGAGHALYTARVYPQAWWNRVAFVCGPTGHLVGTFVLSPKGASFSDTSPFNLLASDDEWSAPTMAEVGPDGQVWVIDWYNYIVQHNPTPQGFETGKGNAYESDLRDKTHGRIYRVVYDAPHLESTQPPKLSASDPKGLVAALKNTNRLWRRHAQRLLVERGQSDVVPELIKLVADQQHDEVGLN
ncbi:MAG: PVC-type heme-binding CxxCH protein, partial [Aureliella sp.]